MPLFLTEKQKELKRRIRDFTEKEIIPVRAYHDEKEEYPESLVGMLNRDMGLACPFIPGEYGGAGLGIFETALIVEELSRGCLGIATAYSVSGLGAYPVLLGGSREQKSKYLPEIASGKKTAAFALTESAAGSDITAIKTSAEKKGEKYILNGTKHWITGASRADIYSVFAVTNKEKGIRGISAFIIEKDTPGMSFGVKKKMLGIRCADVREVFFRDCEVPAANLIGLEGHGFKYAIETFDNARAAVAAAAVGLSQGAYEIALKFASKRKHSGNPVISFQAIQHMLADMAINIEAGRNLTYTAARMADLKDPSHAKYSSMAKAFCGENTFRIANTALQITGGYGYMSGFPLEKMLRDARVLSIFEGTTEILKNSIARDLIKESKSKKK